jgi:pimeloyl-ACP methyl ester carboxylesterase
MTHIGAAPLGSQRLSRRSAVGKLAGAGAAMAAAAAGFGITSGPAHAAPARMQSSVVTNQKGISMTDATPTPNELTVVLVHGAFADASSWIGVIERLEAAGIPTMCPPNPLRGISHDAAYMASYLAQIPGPVLLVGHSYGGAVITNAGSRVKNAVGLVYVAGFAPDEGETLLDVEKNSRDSVLLSALIPLQYPTGNGEETATEFAIRADQVQPAFAADLSAAQCSIIAATQRPIAEVAFAEPTTSPAWKTLPTWAVVPTGDKTIGADVVRSMAERAGATITEVDASHVVMVSQPQAVVDTIMTAFNSVTYPPYLEVEAA